MKIDPLNLLAEMEKNASARKAVSLRLLATICEEQNERGSRDFSVATIGRISSDRGGPSAAAIRNKPGEDYRALLKAFADWTGGHSKKKRTARPSEAESILEGVVDPVLKTRITLMLAEMSALRAQLQASRHLLNQNAVIQLGAPVEERGQARAGELHLTFHEMAALEAALAPSALAHWGWTVEDSGRVMSETGQIVFRAGFATALKKIVEHYAI
ncbi:gamma-mobile-trio protein GmtX [Ralstonia nicotianae]